MMLHWNPNLVIKIDKWVTIGISQIAKASMKVLGVKILRTLRRKHSIIHSIEQVRNRSAMRKCWWVSTQQVLWQSIGYPIRQHQSITSGKVTETRRLPSAWYLMRRRCSHTRLKTRMMSSTRKEVTRFPWSAFKIRAKIPDLGGISNSLGTRC